MNTLFNRLNKIYVEQLSNCSEVCRKIVFALYAVTWGLSFTEGKIAINKYTLVVFILLTSYLLIDALQYYLTALSYRKHFHSIKNAILNGELIEKIEEKEPLKRKRINDRSFILMNFKVCLLPFIFIGLIFTIIEKYSITFNSIVSP